MLRGIGFALILICVCYDAAADETEFHRGRNRAGEEALRKARQELYQEWVHFQVVGRSHSPAEKKRIRVLDQSVKLVDTVIRNLGYSKVEEGETSPEY